MQGKCTVQKAKGLNPQHSVMGPHDLGRLGCSEAKAWILGAWTENDAHMAYEYVPCSRMEPRWFCTGTVKTFVLEPYEQYTLNQMSRIKDISKIRTTVVVGLCTNEYT